MAKDEPELYRQLYETGSLVEAAKTEAAQESADKATEPVQELTATVAEKLNLEVENAATGDDKKHQSRGGKGLQRDEGAKLDKEAQKRAVS